MFDMLLVVWGVALLVFLALAKLLVWKLRSGARSVEDGPPSGKPGEPGA